MGRNVTHWLVEDSDYYDPPNHSEPDVLDFEGTSEQSNEEVSYEDILP
jgi:hypothetical protein